MNDSKTAAEFASELYSYLDSSAGDYSELEDQLDKYEQTSSVQVVLDKLQSADECLEKAFMILDNDILKAIEYDGSGGREFVQDVSKEVRKVAELVSDAEKYVFQAFNNSKNVDIEDFKFGIHTDVVSAFKYLLSDVENMAELGHEMKIRV